MLDAKNASGIGESERKVLESIIKDKVKLIDGLKSGFDKQLEKQIKDGTIPADKKAEAQKAIDAYTADLKKDGSVGWNIISKNLGGFITNNGVALGGGVTFDLPANFLADNVNLGFGYSKSGGFGVGITFDKAITKDTKLLYGWAGAPFIGMTTQFEKWQFTGIAGVGGGMIDVTLQMGNKDLELGRMEAMKSAEKILSQIDKLTSETLPEKIVFTADVSSYPKTSTDPMEMTQDRAQKLNDAINTDIQNRLIIAGYGKEQNPIVRSQMIYNALSQ